MAERLAKRGHAMAEAGGILEAIVGEDTMAEKGSSSQKTPGQTETKVCGICLDELSGESHVIEECQHVFCEGCLKLHCHNAMKQRAWIIKCPGSGCDVTISAGVLWVVLDQITFSKQQQKAGDQEIENRVFEEEQEVDWCPKCRGISRVSPEVHSNGRRRADCEQCGYPFCTRCRNWWHGRLVECSHRKWQEIRTSVMMTISGGIGPDGWEDKVKGRKAEDALSNKLIMDTTTPCPKCHAAIARTWGCNSMMCSRCHFFFCYGCGLRSNACRCRQAASEAQQPPIVTSVREILELDPSAFDRVQCATCPACHRLNRKRNSDNHIRCVVCKTSFCFACKERIAGAVSDHFRKGKACVQHKPIESLAALKSSDIVFWLQEMYGSHADGLENLVKIKNPPPDQNLFENEEWKRQFRVAMKALEIEAEELAARQHVKNVRPGDVVRKNNVLVNAGRRMDMYTR